MALKLHFSKESYDFFKFTGKLKTPLDASKRRDKWHIVKLAKHPDPTGLLVSNLSINNNIKWVGDLFTEKSNETYKKFVKRIESLTYNFKEELKKFNPNFTDNFTVPVNSHPYALRLFLGGHISLETLVIINDTKNFYPYWDKQLQEDIIWQSIRLQIPKYRPFLRFDHDKFHAITQERFSQR